MNQKGFDCGIWNNSQRRSGCVLGKNIHARQFFGKSGAAIFEGLFLCHFSSIFATFRKKGIL
jgi:hypothetical protein